MGTGMSVEGDACITMHLGGRWHQVEGVQQGGVSVQRGSSIQRGWQRTTRAGVQQGTKPMWE